MSNVPTIFANALRRFQSSTAPNTGRAPTVGGGGGTLITGPITVVANDPEAFARQMEDYGARVEWRGGYSRFSPALTGGV
jgi:hypothetical protein